MKHKVEPFDAHLYLIPQEQVAKVWSLAEPHLRRAEARHSVRCVEDWLGECINAKAQLWILWADNDECLGAGITSIVDAPEGRLCIIEAYGAERTKDDLLHTIEKFAKDNGCQRVRINGRIGWMARLKGYKPIGVILDRELAA